MAVIDKNKFLGKNERGGSLAVRPKEELTKISKPEESSLYTIKSKVVQIDKLLKGTLAFEKVKRKQEKQDIEQEQRSQKEQDVEKPKQDDQEKDTPNKIKVPKLSFLDGVKNFLKNILIGWLAVRLLDNLPAVLKVLKVIAKVADWLIDFVGKILNGLATFIDWGYRAYDATRNFIGNVFGRKGVQIFDGIAGTLNKVFNLIGMVALAALAFGNAGGDGGGRPRGRGRIRNIDLPNSRFNRINNRRTTSLGRQLSEGPLSKAREFVRNINPFRNRPNITGVTEGPLQKITDIFRRKPNITGVTEGPLQKITDIFRRKPNITGDSAARNIDIGKIFGNITKRGEGLLNRAKNVDWKQVGRNIDAFLPDLGAPFRKLGEIGSNVLKRGSEIVSGAYQGLKNFGGSTLKYIQEIPEKVKTQYDDIAKKIGPIIGEKLGSWKNKFDEIGATLGKQLDKLSPSKMLENITNMVRKNLDKVVDGNPAVKKLLENLKPKKALGFVSKNFDKIGKKMMPIVDVVRKNKGLADGLGPVDIALDAIFAIVDYAAFGESPVNAILKATAGTLGFAAGSAIGTAITGGVPSPLSFMGGIVGAGIAEAIVAKMISGILHKFPELAEIQDPIAENLGLTPRPLIRDPSGLLDHMIKGAGEETNVSDINNSTTSNNNQNSSELVSGASNDRSGSVANFASYEESNNGTTIIMSNDGGANSNVSGGNNDTAVSTIDTGSSATSEMNLAAYAGG